MIDCGVCGYISDVRQSDRPGVTHTSTDLP